MEVPSTEIYTAILSGDINSLWNYPREQLRPFLPFICQSAITNDREKEEEETSDLTVSHEKLQSLLCELEDTNKIMKYLQLNFMELKSDAIKEQKLLRKLTHSEILKRNKDSVLVASGEEERLAIKFEKGSEEKRFRLVLSELLRVITQVEAPFEVIDSDIFECEVYLSEVSHILSIAVRELSSLLPLTQVMESLLRVKNGPHIICNLMANQPFYYKKVLNSLVLNGEVLDEISQAGRLRSQTLRNLVTLFPSEASYVQWLAFTNQRLPTLMIFIALDIEEGRLGGVAKGGGVLSLMSDIVIHGDKEKRNWFLQYMKLMQQKYRRHATSAVTALRKYLMKKLIYFITDGNKTTPLSDDTITMEVSNEVFLKEEEREEEREGEEERGEEREGERGEEREGEEREEERGEEGEEHMDTITLELVDQMEIEISEIEEEKSEMTSENQKHTSRKRSQSFSLTHITYPPISLSNQLNDTVILQLTELLHVCCGLKVQVHMYLTNEESAAILRLITCTCPPFSSAGVQFIEISLSILLACPFLICSEEGEQSVVRWLNWILEYLPEFERALPGERVYGEMLLLVVIHLQEKQLKQIEKLILTALGMKAMSSVGSAGQFATLKELFLSVFKEEIVCSHALSVPPTPSLSNLMTGYLPVHCVHQLMCSKAFRRHDISVKGWIYKQLCTTSEPLHSSLPLLIEEYVQAMLVTPFSSSSRHNKTTVNIVQTPFTAEEVLSVFQNIEATPTSDHAHHSTSSQILILYYVLYYQEVYLSHLKTLLPHSGSHSFPKAYGPSVLLQLPVKRLLYHVSTHQEAYLSVYPSLLRLIVGHFPHLYLPEDWIKQDSINQSINVRPILKLSSKKVTVDVATEILSQLHAKPSQALLVLTHLSSLSYSCLVPFSSPLVSTLPLLLTEGSSSSKRIQQLYTLLWMKLNSIIPRKLWVDTVNSLRPSNQKTHPLHTHQNLLEDPLIILRCDLKVFRCSSVLEILLRVLAAYTSASRVWLSEHAHTLNCMTDNSSITGQEREELRIALTAAQESSIIQLLLEICLPNEQDKKEASILGSQLTVLREVQCLICSYLHQVFISEPGMVKLIHFQTYPLILLPLLATSVPSMHIVTDFLPELLAHHELEKQIFGIHLSAHVIHQYPLADHMGIVTDIFKKLTALITELSPTKLTQIFPSLFPSFVLFCRSFPQMSDQVTELLLHLCRVSLLHKSNESLPITVDQSSWSSTDSDDCKRDLNGKEKELLKESADKELFSSGVTLLEKTLVSLNKMNIIEGAQWTFKEISKTVLLKQSGHCWYGKNPTELCNYYENGQLCPPTFPLLINHRGTSKN